MLLWKLNPETIDTTYIVYVLSDTNGPFYAGTVKSSDLPRFKGAHFSNGEIMLNQIAVKDTLAFAQDCVLKWCLDHNRPDIRERFVSALKRYKNGRMVKCVETGEQFISINKACDALKVTYAQLYNHLAGKKGYRSVRGKHYTFF